MGHNRVLRPVQGVKPNPVPPGAGRPGRRALLTPAGGLTSAEGADKVLRAKLSPFAGDCCEEGSITEQVMTGSPTALANSLSLYSVPDLPAGRQLLLPVRACASPEQARRTEQASAPTPPAMNAVTSPPLRCAC